MVNLVLLANPPYYTIFWPTISTPANQAYPHYTHNLDTAIAIEDQYWQDHTHTKITHYFSTVPTTVYDVRQAFDRYLYDEFPSETPGLF